MDYNFINEAVTVRPSPLCKYDTNVGYATDFSVNGDVDGWDYYDGIHTYTCWGNFLFGTLYGSYALVGRNTIFQPVPAETHYVVTVTMKINPIERVGSQPLPTTGRLMWITASDGSWDTTKSHDFDINADNLWNVYNLNLGEEQWWQGDITNLRLYPIYEDGRDGDEFFIKSIKIISVDTYDCKNTACDYYLNYSHPCPGAGSKGYCKSSAINAGTYNIEEDVNDELIININDYGNETINLDPIQNANGLEIAKILTAAISKIGIGGYAEVEIDYTDDGEFIIYSGTYTESSNVVIVDCPIARTLGFFDDAGVDLSTRVAGTTPASGFAPSSSFRIKSFQLLTLFDGDSETGFSFNPYIYNIEAGRKDWLDGGIGRASAIETSSDESVSPITGTVNTVEREYDLLENSGKTMIDFNHPFNASGRIKNISLACTLDQGWDDSYSIPGENFQGRIEATNCKVKILRPKKNGNLEVVHTLDIPNRNYSGGRLYSFHQEHTEIECDIWVNKGDLIGVYNANLYRGKSISGEEVDALYYHINGEVSGEFDPGKLYGDGLGGLLVYARSDEIQDKLVIDVDLGYRVNIEDIDIYGSVESNTIEFNVARCLDIDWEVDLFGGQHYTEITNLILGLDYNHPFRFLHDNIAYGIDKLDDGVKIVNDGIAADGYIGGEENIYSHSTTYGPPGYVAKSLVPINPRYFYVNGDSEWLGVYQHIGSNQSRPIIEEFNEDPIAFTLIFPYNKSKRIYKSAIYFKEQNNFRNFSLSYMTDVNDIYGNAEDERFYYIPDYTAVTMDNIRIENEGPGYSSVKEYLFTNPSLGEQVIEYTGETSPNGNPMGVISNYEANLQASQLDWNILIHEFEPIDVVGFRFYCDYHYSTKITEMELYCEVDDVGSNLIGGMSIIYSYYNDLWWTSSLTQESDSKVNAFIGDTPRYFKIEIEPITQTTLNTMNFNVKDEAGYIGQKGCEYILLPDHSKSEATNEAERLEIKNIYGADFDLYVDIAKDEEIEDRLIYHSTMASEEAITNPEVGPDTKYYNADDYPIVNRAHNNCAINCDCWGLRNLIDGKTAYYSNDNGYTWNEFGTLASGVAVDFSNITVSNFSIINIPVYYRDRYWKIGWLCEDHIAMNVREMVPFYNEEELACTFYHNKDLPFEDGPMVDTAPHLRNDSVTGSYYKLQGGTNIGLDLGSQKELDRIMWFHDVIDDYDQYRCGIDKYTTLNLTVKDSNIIDYSYDEHTFDIGTGITIDHGKFDFDYSEVTTISGLYSDSDTNPTSKTLSNEPELVDGVLWEETAWTGSLTLTTNHSLGVDLGSPKEVTRIRFYLNLPDNYSGLSWRYHYTNNWYIYKSDDNVNWTLCYTMKEDSPPLEVQDNSWEFYSEFFFPVNQTARYFKLWCEEPMYVYATQSWYNIPSCSEIKIFSEITNSYKTGISFPGDYNSYISVPANSDFTFPGTNNAAYGTVCKSFTLDFYVKFNDLPVVSGTDYCTLVRNWSDPVTTVKYGDISFPPENWMAGYMMEQGGVGSPDANYAVFVRSVYDVARVDGASYSATHLYNGTLSDLFDGDVHYNYCQFNAFPFYVQCNLPTAKKVTKYGLKTYSGSTTSRNLKSWTLQGYITASGTWIDLHSVSNFGAWTEDQVNYWEFTNPYNACTQYRLNATANWGDSYTWLYEIELYDDYEGIDPTLYQLEFWAQSYNPSGFYGGTQHEWARSVHPVIPGGIYHVCIRRDVLGDPYYIRSYINGERCYNPSSAISTRPMGMNSHCEDLIIGEGLNGIISEFRITKDLDRLDYEPNRWHVNERFYTMSIYSSVDNILYGKYCDIDLYKENSYSIYDSDSVFSSNYYCQLAIDLENRYDIEFIRSYGDSDTQPFSIWDENSTDIYYSNDEVSDVSEVTWATRDSYTNIKTLYSSEVYGANSTQPGYVTVAKSFTAVDCAGLTKENGIFSIDMRLSAADYIDTSVIGQIEITSAGTYNSEEWHYTLYNTDLSRLTTSYQTFYFLMRDFITTGGELDVGQINYIRVYVYSGHTQYTLYLYWKNAKVIWPITDALDVTNDVRWLRFDLLSGDGTSRVIRKLGIYPDISTQISPAGGHYNHEWDYLGKSITSYESSTNLALEATVSGSSYFGMMTYDNLVNGEISSSNLDLDDQATLYEAWGSDGDSNPWVSIDLGAVYSIYRVKIYHGYDDTDDNYMVTDYTVQTSTNGLSFSTIFTISDNSEFVRTHDLADPVQARFVKVNITGYDYTQIALRTSYETDDVAYFTGAVMREIEVYEYYGYPKINSEEYPIVAINLNDQFYLSSHSIVGMDINDTSTDWVNDDCYFCYSDSVFDNPSKVDFREWRVQPYYDQWVVIRMDTAENYRNGPHYLKHVRIESSSSPNPCDYPWWWQSNVSTISRDYSYYVINSTSALKIEYPASTALETIAFIEGDDFGIDTEAAWRDGFNFRIRFDDIDNLDRSYGYFYFGGYDDSSGNNPVVHKWNISTLSGSLSTGWNNMFLRFKTADEVEYIDTEENIDDVRIPSSITFGTIGMRFKGLGNPLTINIDGFKIERNRFYDYGAHGAGCYINNNDFITSPIGEASLTEGTIEFWLRPDYNDRGRDYFNVFRNRTLFHFNSNSNDVFGMMVTYKGFELYCGNIDKPVTIYSLTDFGMDILDSLLHFGVVFSNNGTQISNDRSTIRLYINNFLSFKTTDTWQVYDNKHFSFILGGKGSLNLKADTLIETGSVDGVISDFKIYNYCKTDFRQSMLDNPDPADLIVKPSKFIEISKDNITYYKVGDTSLPLKYEDVPAGNTASVYVRTIVPDNLSGFENRTARLLTYWDISV